MAISCAPKKCKIMAEDRQEIELIEVNTSRVRVLDANGNSGLAKVEAIGAILGIENYRFRVAPNATQTLDVLPGIYIAQAAINPEIVVFCIGYPGRADWGIHVLLGSSSGAFSFTGEGPYVNITLSTDGYSIRITNKYAGEIRVTIKRMVL